MDQKFIKISHSFKKKYSQINREKQAEELKQLILSLSHNKFISFDIIKNMKVSNSTNVPDFPTIPNFTGLCFDQMMMDK